VWGEKILLDEFKYEYEYRGQKRTRANWPRLWMQLINVGTFIPTIAVSDSHEITLGGVGGWRTYLPSSSDKPSEIDPAEVIRHAKSAHSFVTSGPFLEVKTADGDGPGSTVSARETITLNIRVQCNTWVKIDRVLVLSNGRVIPELDFTRVKQPEIFKDSTVVFDQSVDVPLVHDAHLIVVAAGENHTLAKGYGRSWQKDLHPIAYHNPIFVDTDGNGFQHNGDTLGEALLPEN
jgi:hypothetical protein